MDIFDQKQVLKTFEILVDTREQDTKRARKRYESFGVPWRRFPPCNAPLNLKSIFRFFLKDTVCEGYRPYNDTCNFPMEIYEEV